MSSKKVIIKKKPKRVIQGRSFKLIDFRIFDGNKESDSSGEDSDKPKGSPNFHIQMFGINETGETCMMSVNNYLPFFYVKVGRTWNKDDAQELLQHIRQKLPPHIKMCAKKAELVEHYKLYGFSAGNKDQFVKLTFQNMNSMNKTKSLWYKYLSEKEKEKTGNYRKYVGFSFKKTALELYESNIPPLLRYFHIYNISPSGWIFVDTGKSLIPEKYTTTCKYEYICQTNCLKPLPDKEAIVPYKICSFDIEASSSHGDFPVPIKTYKRVASNCVDVFMRMKQTQTLNETQAKKLLKRCILTAFDMDKLENVDLVYTKTKPSKNHVNSRIELLLKTSIKDLTNAKEEDVGEYADVGKLLCLEEKFEKTKEKEEEGGEGVEGHVSDFQAREVDDYSASDNWTKVKSVAGNQLTIVNMLLGNDHDRETKINELNMLLCKLFPRVEGDKVTFIGSTFMKYGEKMPYLNHCLVLNSCDPVENAEIETVTNETDLLLKWRDLIQREDPDVIIGYNIFGFDYEFMFRRSQELHCEHEFLKLSRMQDQLCAKQKDGEYFIENTKIVLATGEYDLKYYGLIGRLQIDMYTYFRRDFNLASYKLDDVASQYISDKIVSVKHDVHEKYGEVTQLCSKNLVGLNRGDFIHIELSGFTSDYYEDGRKYRVLDIEKNKEFEEEKNGEVKMVKHNVILLEGTMHIDSGGKGLKWGMSKDDVTPQDIFRLTRGSSTDRAVVAKYCIQDCNLVHHLMNKIDVLTGYVEMSRICSVPISFLIFRGQGIKLTSYVAKKCREKDTLMPDLEKGGANDGYEGAIVLPPKCNMYMDNPVACVDYASLYPSSMISQNYSHDSKVWTREYDLEGKLVAETGEKDNRGNYIYDNLPGYQYIDIEFDTYRYTRKTPTSRAEKVISGKKTCRWAQLPDNQKSIMPSILEELLKARKDTRKLIKSEPDPFMQNILDKRQLGYKVTANSLYGQCGAKTSTFYEKDVAASTTATGRMMITYAKRMIEEVYGDRICETSYGKARTRAEYIYGDTDSVFFTLNLEDADTGEKIRGQRALEMTIELGQEIGNFCSSWLKAPQFLEYEKTLMPFILLSKKRYVGMLYEEDPNKGAMKFMGLSLKRRDSCDYLKDTYGGILNILMKDNNILNAIDFLNHSLQQLIDGNVSMEKLAITKALRSDYKNPMQIGHWVLAEKIGKRDPGNKPKPGDRMKFVFVENNEKKALMGDKIETPDFIVQNKLPIDYAHYITNQLMKPLQQLFGLALEQIYELQRKTAALKNVRKEYAKLEQEESDLELLMKKREKFSSAKIKTLLFEKYLTKISHKRNGLQSITKFF
jgi:DNA polymerase elongation subunit (family B)